MLKLSEATKGLLQYWQETAFRKALSSSPNLKGTSLLAEHLKSGKLDSEIASQFTESQTVWIAPWVFKPKQGFAQNLIPMWIPAIVKAGQLCPTATCALPWLPMPFFDLQNTGGTLFERIEQYDKYLLDHFFDEQANPVIFSDWESYFSASMKLLTRLLKPHIKEFLDQDYNLDETALMIDKPDSAYLEQASLAALLARYASLEELNLQIEKQHSVRSDLRALLQIINLNSGDLQTCQIPIGAQKTEFMKVLMACLWAKTVTPEKTPTIVWVGLQKPELNWVADNLASDDNIQETDLASEFKCFKEGLELFDKYVSLNEQLVQQFGSLDAIDRVLTIHQANDQKLETEFDRCRERYQEWQKQYPASIWTHLLTWFPYMQARRQKLIEAFFKDYLKPLDAASDIQLNAEQRIINKMGQIKVARTKIHTELVDLSQWLAAKNGTKKRWVEWLAQNNQKTDTLDWSAGERLVKKYYASLVEQGFENIKFLSIEEALAPNADIANLEIDYLLIDNADKMMAARVLPLLAQAKTAVFLGEELAIPIQPSMSPIYDTAVLKACELAASEEALEDLSYRGIHAAGSAFCVAKALKTLPYDLQLSSPPVLDLRVQHISAVGEMEAVGLSYCNLKEAQGIIEWLLENPNRPIDTTILTLFQGQKTYLIDCLKSLGLHVPVLLLNEANALQKSCILFSPVYTRSQPRPYLLDEGEARLKKLCSYATQSLFIFGDRDIFNSHTHTPSGQIAKLFEEEITAIEV